MSFVISPEIRSLSPEVIRLGALNLTCGLPFLLVSKFILPAYSILSMDESWFILLSSLMIARGNLIFTLSVVILSTSAIILRSLRLLSRLYEDTPPFLFPKILLRLRLFGNKLLMFIGTAVLLIFIGVGPFDILL